MGRRAAATDLRRRVGRRGACLLAFAFIDFVLAWSLIDPETKAQTAALPTYRAHLAIAPLDVWAVAWLIVALSCAIHAFRSRDQIGFALAIGIKLVWAAAFAASWLIYGVPRAWLGAALWLVVGCLVMVISGWVEPPRQLAAIRPPPAQEERP